MSGLGNRQHGPCSFQQVWLNNWGRLDFASTNPPARQSCPRRSPVGHCRACLCHKPAHAFGQQSQVEDPRRRLVHLNEAVLQACHVETDSLKLLHLEVARPVRAAQPASEGKEAAPGLARRRLKELWPVRLAVGDCSEESAGVLVQARMLRPWRSRALEVGASPFTRLERRPELHRRALIIGFRVMPRHLRHEQVQRRHSLTPARCALTMAKATVAVPVMVPAVATHCSMPLSQDKWPDTLMSTRSSDPRQEPLNFLSIEERELLNIRRPLLPRQQPQSLSV